MSVRIFKHYKIILLLVLVYLTSGCASFNYYSQSIQGQIEIFQKTRDIGEIVQNENTPEVLREKLHTVLKIRDFSITQLGLPDNQSYRSYADIEREYVVWNIFATEEFSLKPMQSCFLFVGCLHYRGYFAKEAAKAYAEQLKSKGMDVYLGGVSAYSTLGWFDDPVLNTMLHWSEARLATVIFHELTHQLIYIKGDTEFNESLADAVGIIGVRQWLTRTGQTDKLKEYENYLDREKTFVDLILKYKPVLENLYAENSPAQLKRKNKAKLFEQIKNEYQLIKQSWERDYYGNWITSKLNNASVASIISYRKYLPAFMDLYTASGDNIKTFLNKAMLLSKCTKDERQRILNNITIKIMCRDETKS